MSFQNSTSATARTALAAQVLVISPDRALVQTVERCALSLGHAALVAESLDDARRVLLRATVSVICVDSLLSAQAEQLWRWATETLPDGAPPVVLLASPVDEKAPSAVPEFLRGERAGAVAKPVRSGELARELTRLLAAQPRRDQASELLHAGRLALDVDRHQLLFEDGGQLALTPTEARLLRCLLLHAGAFVSPDELLEDVWGYPPGTGGREVVRAHVSNVRRKLRDMGKDPQLLRGIPYLGYGIGVGDATPT